MTQESLAWMLLAVMVILAVVGWLGWEYDNSVLMILSLLAFPLYGVLLYVVWVA